MSTNDWLYPIFEASALRSPYFFNGRLLSEEDLTSEHEANREQQKRLGRALGAGVAYGLDVSLAKNTDPPNSVLQVSGGLALNQNGRAIVLTAETTPVPLTHPSQPLADTTAGFNNCHPAQFGGYTPDAGVYVFTIAPTEGKQGRAPVNGLGNATARCNARERVEGVSFRLVSLGLTDFGDLNTLRNRLAYQCLGVTHRASAFAADPFGPSAGGNSSGRMPPDLTACEVPLALIYWTKEGVAWVDRWAVRRRLTRPNAGGVWEALCGDQPLAKGEAMFLQFQEHIAEMPAPASFKATDCFRYLPPVGLLPLSGHDQPSDFFKGLPTREPVFIEGAALGPLVRTALAYPPIEMHSSEFIWLYQVHENRDPRLFNPSPLPAPYVIFARGDVPFFGTARFNIGHYNYANYYQW